ncbi:MAG: B12-binding domain-containing radical SAM protein, partial [Tannerellaceae bacterium]
MQQINLLWLDINASFSHSSLALPALHAQCQNQEWNRQIEWKSITASINTNLSSVITQILQHQPDIIAATSWLFTSDYLLAILQRVKTLCPHVTIVLGGPEFLGNNEIYLSQHNYISAVFRGEGEIVFSRWLQAYIKTNKQTFKPYCGDAVIDGLCYIDSTGVYHDNGIAKVQNYDQLAFPETSPFFCKTKAFVQLETTRGCFNTCAFCVSGADKPVRSLSLDSIRKRLNMYAEWGVENVRLLDRTFNGSSKRALALLQLFEEYENKLAFHLEIHPAYLNDEVRTKLQTIPKGLLHLEAGI